MIKASSTANGHLSLYVSVPIYILLVFILMLEECCC